MREIGKAVEQYIARQPKGDESSLTTRVSKSRNRVYMFFCQGKLYI